MATAQKACELATIFREDALLARNRELLELYRSGKPYHETGQTAENQPQINRDEAPIEGNQDYRVAIRPCCLSRAGLAHDNGKLNARLAAKMRRAS